MDHSELIDRLGGPTALGKALGGISGKRVHNWKVRGVAPEYRHAVAILAGRQGVPLPDGFLIVPAESAPSEAA